MRRSHNRRTPFSKPLQTLFDVIETYRGRLVCAVVHLNDTYLIDEQPPTLPGFPRLIATVKALREHVLAVTGRDRVVVVHSGDFLGPSRLGNSDHGVAMIDMLNRSTLRYFVPGNHEFDYDPKTKLEDQLLVARAKFALVCCNVSTPAAVNASEFTLWPTTESPTVAFTGVVSKSVHSSFGEHWPFTDPDAALKTFAGQTAKTPFHVVLSHATREEDRAMRPSLEGCPRTVLLGGHDHHIDWQEDDFLPILYKNRSNLQSVRVLLLMAGDSRTAFNQLWCSYQELKKNNGGVPPPYEQAFVDALLDPLHPCDAHVFRRWIEAKDPCGHEGFPNFSAYAFDQDDDIPDDALVNRLEDLPSVYDVGSHVLKFADFLPATRRDEKAVRKALKQITEPNEDHVVCDFSRDVGQLDARDTQLRERPTDFGLLAAESVRREANADIAIVHSGSFRIDALIDANVTRKRLLDTFIFDKPKPGQDEPIMILTLNNQEIDTLLAHGRRLATTGAFPQIVDKRQSSQQDHVVAISSYLLINPKSNDGYVEAYAKSEGMSEDQARERFSDLRTGQFRIIPAIEKHVAAITYADITPAAQPIQQSNLSNPPMPGEHFVKLAREVRKEFDRVHPDIPTTFEEWYELNEAFLALFAPKAPVPADPPLAKARKALCDFVVVTLTILKVKNISWDVFDADVKAQEANYTDDGFRYGVILGAVVEGLGIPW